MKIGDRVRLRHEQVLCSLMMGDRLTVGNVGTIKGRSNDQYLVEWDLVLRNSNQEDLGYQENLGYHFKGHLKKVKRD